MNVGKSKVVGRPNGATLYVTVPADVAQDSKCPVKSGDDVFVIIEGDNLVITKKPKVGRGRSR